MRFDDISEADGSAIDDAAPGSVEDSDASEPPPTLPDATPADADEGLDAALSESPDASDMDAGLVDATTPSDAWAVDAAPLDVGELDASGVDAQLDDAAPLDAAAPDTSCTILPEACDGLDNDCNGLIDDLSAPGMLCAAGDVCAGGGCVPVPAAWSCTTRQAATHAYALCATGADLATAFDHCASVGAHLVTITSDAENAWITEWARTGAQDVWLGLHSAPDCSAWLWDTGEPATFFGWAAGLPDQNCTVTCAQLWHSIDFAWDDSECAQNQAYICEWE